MNRSICTGVLLCISLFLFGGHMKAEVIHITQKGDSLYKIGDRYNVTADQLAKLNGMPGERKLVQGQSILIPGQSYMVQPGDSLYKIAKRHQIPIDELMELNGLHSSLILTGDTLQIPQKEKTNVKVGAYFIPKDQGYNDEMMSALGRYLTTIYLFSYNPNQDGTLSSLPLNNSVAEAWRKGISPFATLTNLSGSGFDPELAHDLMANENKRKKLIENLYMVLDRHDYKGVVIDFEGLRPEDRSLFSSFIKQVGERLHPHNMEVHIAVPPMSGSRSPSYAAAYDYKTLGRYADSLFLMTYNWHWLGGASGPIAPIQEIKKTLDFATSVVPREKLMLGIPMYAYDWVVSKEGVKGKAYSVQHAISKYIQHESSIHYDEQSEAPWFRYKDEAGRTHEVWFEDPRSLLAKFELVRGYRLGGMGAWQLDFSIRQSETLLRSEFNVLK
ncbi:MULTISPECIES: glycosyl hydrolase family 18 protein [Pontibacillus]|uniref:Glycosyl hydrolase family 18 protein n=1 Tax=Pontibacillus chungwhensis TaxID=265426 RepID=A0ABY8UX72_9BACI|nr:MULTISPECIES: glycosyl hydrolase family 18 protein [Pontibacillus]MCD5323728.1 glycosyl hydrolase family 18 protein [Pontibacillus sp. HN14]WIF97094.1 glycosyl hydrolase family 18 protein [Pontibacillus chungwhensis]